MPNRTRLSLIIVIPLLLSSILGYIQLTWLLYNPESLTRGLIGEPLEIYDRNGKLLQQFNGEDPVRYKSTRLSEIPMHCQNAIVATEDKTFWSNPGFDLAGIARGITAEVTGIPYGGSSITQQLVKISERSFFGRSPLAKLNEVIYGVRVAGYFSKEQILEMYLNNVYFGNYLYGIGTAAEQYLGKKPSELSLTECAYLAGIPNQPVVNNPYSNLAQGYARRDIVLELMFRNQYISEQEKLAAQSQEIIFTPNTTTVLAPHFSTWVLERLETDFPEIDFSQDGLDVYTTYDYKAHSQILEYSLKHIQQLEPYGANNAGIVGITTDGEVRVMVGSVDFFDENRNGRFNNTLGLVQAGSTLKPFVYGLAFEQGFRPGSLILDAEITFPNPRGISEFEPRNADLQYHGLQTIRSALANSYNIPAIKMADILGAVEVVNILQEVGLWSVSDAETCGLVAVVGACRVSIFDLAYAYAVFPNQGDIPEVTYISEIRDINKDSLYIKPAEKNYRYRDVYGDLSSEITYSITDILSDDNARRPEFGSRGPLNTSYPSAVKTGTTQDFKDALTVGYTPDFIVSVWVGHNSGIPMEDISGAVGAGPIWNYSLDTLVKENQTEFTKPNTIKEIHICTEDLGDPDISPSIPYDTPNSVPIADTNCNAVLSEINF